jgi:hypothetical protein
MNNFKFYVQELKKVLMASNKHENNNEHHEYLVPKKASDVKKERSRKQLVISVSRSSPAYDFFMTEFRGNRLSCDEDGNVLVPESDYFSSHKTR